MNRVFLFLFVPAMLLTGCGNNSSAQSSPFCQSVGTVKADVAAIKASKGNYTISTLTADLQKLQKDVNTALSQTKDTAGPEANAVKTSVQALKETLTNVKDKKITLSDALPTVKTQAQAVSENWQALKDKLKC